MFIKSRENRTVNKVASRMWKMHPYTRKPSLSWVKPFNIILFALLVCAITFIAPHNADAWPTRFTNCMNCHADEDADGDIFTAIDGIDETPAIAGDPINITLTAGESFEVDWYFTNSTDAAGGYGIGVSVSVPTGWPIADGTSLVNNLPGWNIVWDLADGVGWDPTIFDTSSYLPNSEGKTVNFAGTTWETGSRQAACDGGPTCINGGTDNDLTAETMGTDALITVPLDATPGTYDVMVFGVGHDSINNGRKAHKDQVIKVTVQAPAGIADYHTDIGTGSYGGFTVDWTTCGNPATGSIGILKQDIGNYDCASAQQTYSGTPGEQLMTWVMTTPYSTNTDITGGMLYAHIENTDNKNDATVRFQRG
jgi:hypothetical protein